VLDDSQSHNNNGFESVLDPNDSANLAPANNTEISSATTVAEQPLQETPSTEQEQIMNTLVPDVTPPTSGLSVNGIPEFEASAKAEAEWQTKLSQPIGHDMDQFMDQVDQTEESEVPADVQGEARSSFLDTIKNNAIDWAKNNLKVFGGKAWNELSSDDQQMWIATGHIGNHALGLFNASRALRSLDPEGLVNGVNKSVGSGDALSHQLTDYMNQSFGPEPDDQ
jgi:hypothetical protein